MSCHQGFVRKEDCGMLGKCTVDPPTDTGVSATCEYLGGCDTKPGCRGSLAAFCDVKQAVSFNCASVGMACASEGGHSRCTWPQPP